MDMNTKDLRDMVIAELKALAEGKTSNAKAANVARLAASIVATKKLEIAADVHKRTYGAEAPSIKL